VSDPNHPPGVPQYQQPPGPLPQPGPPPAYGAPPVQPMASAALTTPRTPLGTIQMIAKYVLVLGYVCMGAALMSGIMVLTIDGLEGSQKFAEFMSAIALGAGLGGTALGIGALLRHRLLERGQI
jgi:hypothetical protein